LQDFNSFEKLALIMRCLIDMIKALPDTGDRLLSEKAKDYVHLMYQMSLAIKTIIILICLD